MVGRFYLQQLRRDFSADIPELVTASIGYFLLVKPTV
jgi:hypothetical protein